MICSEFGLCILHDIVALRKLAGLKKVVTTLSCCSAGESFDESPRLIGSTVVKSSHYTKKENYWTWCGSGQGTDAISGEVFLVPSTTSR